MHPTGRSHGAQAGVSRCNRQQPLCGEAPLAALKAARADNLAGVSIRSSMHRRRDAGENESPDTPRATLLGAAERLETQGHLHGRTTSSEERVEEVNAMSKDRAKHPLSDSYLGEPRNLDRACLP